LHRKSSEYAFGIDCIFAENRATAIYPNSFSSDITTREPL